MTQAPGRPSVPQNQPAIRLRDIGKSFGGVRALDGVSLEVMPGELHAIMGENGAGKSTLMKILSGVILEYEGDISLDGELVRFGGTRDAEWAGISIIHQELNLVEQLSVADNIYLGRELTLCPGILDRSGMVRRAEEWLQQLQCPISPRASVASLRVGDQQLVEIAKALSVGTRILIMDEPTSALTESEVARLDEVIRHLRNNGVTILYISHKMDEVFRLADRITVLRDGRWITTVDKTETTPRQLAHWMVGREIEEATPHARDRGEVVLEVRKLALPWPGHARPWRLKDLNFRVHRGEIVGIAGLMGAGRTELLECLYGISPYVPSGEIMLHGKAVQFRHASEAIDAGIAMVSEDRKRLGLFAQMSVHNNIVMCFLKRIARFGWIRGRRERNSSIEQIDHLRIKADGPDASILSLSGGNQQKCIIARCLLLNPTLLLLDDPTRGIDVGAKSELYSLMHDLASKGMAILVTSSELPELLTLSDRILVLREGTLAAEMNRAEATEQRIMEAATASA